MLRHDTIAIADEKLASLRLFRGHVSWTCLAILVLMRSTGHHASDGIGIALCVDIVASTAVLIYLLVLPTQSKSATKLHLTRARDDLRLRIVTFSGCAMLSVLVNILPYTLAYVAGLAAAIGLLCRVLQIILGLNALNIERYLGTDILRDILIALILFLCVANVFTEAQEQWSIGLQLMVWAVASIATLRSYHLFADLGLPRRPSGGRSAD